MTMTQGSDFHVVLIHKLLVNAVEHTGRILLHKLEVCLLYTSDAADEL